MERRSGQAGIFKRTKDLIYEKTRSTECPLLKKPFRLMLEKNGRAVDVFHSVRKLHRGTTKTFWIRQPRGKIS